MKLKMLLFVALFIFGLTQANSQPVAKGDKLLNLGLGIGSTLYSGTYYKGQIPPISASLEYVVNDEILGGNAALGVGGYLGYSSYKYEYQNWGWKYNNIIIGPRGYFHYNFIENLDTYTGLLLGYNISSSKEFGVTTPGYVFDQTNGGFTWSWFVGGRYFFSDNLAVMAELGYGISYLNVGVTFRLP